MPYKDKEYQKLFKRRHYDVQRAALDAIKASTPCHDCGQRFPHYVMEFDHARGTKKLNISSMCSRRIDGPTVVEEIEKCDLVCANCHKVRSYNRGQFVNNKKNR